MGIPYFYSMRNLRTRRLTTILTATGMGLVVFVFCAVLMLAEGLRAALVESGFRENVLLIRKGSGTEVQSGVERPQAALVEARPEVAVAADGGKFMAKELVVLINLAKRESRKPSNVVIRGIAPQSLPLRPQVKVTRGRMPREGSTELLAGKSIAGRFSGAGLGETLRFAQRDWRIVGIIDAGGSGFDSELWGDADQLMQSFRRPAYSSVLFRLRTPDDFQRFRSWVDSEPRMTVEVKRETTYYYEQSEMMATFLRIMGISLTVIFSVGAVIGAMITMYSAVANRIREIGTLRAIGFRRRDILGAFVLESVFLGLLGGGLGILLASFLQLFTISTMNWQTFSELAFSFTLTPGIAAGGVCFSVFMGLAGGLLPAVRGARMNIVEALRSS